MLMASCSDEYTPWADPQSNEEVAKSVNLEVAAAPAIDFATVTEKTVQLFTPTLTAEETIDSSKYVVTLYNDDKSKSVTVDANAQGFAKAEDVQNAVVELYGKRPDQRNMTMDVKGYAYIGQYTVVKNASTTASATLVAPYISQHYYLIGAPSEWSPTCTTMPFSHSNQDVYDDPVFTVTFPVSDGQTWFAIADDKTVESGQWPDVLGCAEGNGKNGMEGSIERRSNLSDDGSWMIEVNGDAKYVRMTINMMDYTYKLEKINFADYIYEAGNNYSWDNGLSLYGPNADGKYYGAFMLKSGFKFRSNMNDWNGDLNLGLDGSNPQDGKLINDGGSQDIKNLPDGDGFYFVTVDIVNLTYTLKHFTQLGVIGDATPNGWNGITPMTYDESTHTWVLESIKLEGGKSIKFKDEDSNWAGVNLGGSLTKLVQGSNDNISVAESGTYKIVLHTENNAACAPYAELIKK